MKQQIKCPHCKKIFPIEDSLKHEAEEYRKKLQIEEKEKSSIRQKEIELNYKVKAEKQDKEHQAELDQLKEKIRPDTLMISLIHANNETESVLTAKNYWVEKVH